MGQREDLIQIFITESRENIDMLDQGLLRLETEPDNRPLLAASNVTFFRL